MRARNARFWAWVNTGWVKLTLRPGQTLEHTTGGPTDEGYSCESERWEHAGIGVRHEWASWGRDCDGRHESGGERFALLGQLAAVACDDGTPIPDWQAEDSYQRDHTAEAAGY